jgi:hypothetical protein
MEEEKIGAFFVGVKMDGREVLVGKPIGWKNGLWWTWTNLTLHWTLINYIYLTDFVDVCIVIW